MANPSEIYRITFLNKGKVYEVFAKQVYQSELDGFIEEEDNIFDERSQVVAAVGRDPVQKRAVIGDLVARDLAEPLAASGSKRAVGGHVTAVVE